MLGQEPSRGAKQTEVKQRHPSFVVSNEAAVTPGRTARPQEVIISPAIRQLNKDGYIVYNTPEKQDVYITVQPDSVFFEEDEPRMVRMAGGSFVGGNKHPAHAEVHLKPEPEQEPETIVYDQPADIFANASRRVEHEEIDFNEIIIKKNNAFEVEIELPPAFFKPIFEEKYEPVMEESFRMEVKPEMAKTSSAAAKIEPQEMPITRYKEVPEYEVLETQLRFAKREEPKAPPLEGYREVLGYEAQTAPCEKAPTAEIPAGLYVDGRRPTDAAEADAEAAVELSSFIETSMEAETAVTAVSAPAAESIPIEDEAILVPEETEAAEEDVFEKEVPETSETVTFEPEAVEVTDPVADIMKLTVPGLYMSEDLISELAQGWERTIPEDDLESYDCRFKMMKAPAKEENIPCMPSFAFEGRESVISPGPSGGFRF
ncbi:MAG: hypothetical protein LBB30_02545 [Candidatus Methanoplasma sp.]|jgi:hypothetical protein|nr:hypothetical protein [Candidatus Methanoplasma sp.]